MEVHKASPSNLPYELLLYLFTFIAEDRSIIHLLCTQKSLHERLFHDEHFYRDLCRRHTSIEVIRGSFNPSRTFKSMYTELFYSYGPLLGLWASDLPFSGSIVEFNIADYKQGGWEGIVGNVWETPLPGGALRGVPLGFSRSPLLTITLRPFSKRASRHGRSFRPPKISCIIRNQKEKPIPLSLHLLHPTTQSFFTIRPTRSMNERVNQQKEWLDRITLHPEFPSVGGGLPAWYDQDRRLPVLKKKYTQFYDNSLFFPMLQSEKHLLISAPTNTLKPAALALFPTMSGPFPEFAWFMSEHRVPSVVDCRHNAAPTLNLGGPPRDLPPSRYYPLRHPKLPSELLGLSPMDHRWDPGQLEGLWNGSRWPHGNNILFIEFVLEAQEVRVWNIMGDGNLPRGSLVFSFDISTKVQPSEDVVSAVESLGKIPKNVPGYFGKGYQCTNEQSLEMDERPVSVVIINNKEIRARWGYQSLCLSYKRYVTS